MTANGEQRTGVAVFFVNEQIDLGSVIEVAEFPIHPSETRDQFVVRSKQTHRAASLRAMDPDCCHWPGTGQCWNDPSWRNAPRGRRAKHPHGRRGRSDGSSVWETVPPRSSP